MMFLVSLFGALSPEKFCLRLCFWSLAIYTLGLRAFYFGAPRCLDPALKQGTTFGAPHVGASIFKF